MFRASVKTIPSIKRKTHFSYFEISHVTDTIEPIIFDNTVWMRWTAFLILLANACSVLLFTCNLSFAGWRSWKKCTVILRHIWAARCGFLFQCRITTMPNLIFFLTPPLLPACHNVNRFVASCTVVIFPSSCRVDGAVIQDNTTTTCTKVALITVLKWTPMTMPFSIQQKCNKVPKPHLLVSDKQRLSLYQQVGGNSARTTYSEPQCRISGYNRHSLLVPRFDNSARPTLHRPNHAEPAGYRSMLRTCNFLRRSARSHFGKSNRK